MDLSVVSEAYFRPEKAKADPLARKRPVYSNGNAAISGNAALSGCHIKGPDICAVVHSESGGFFSIIVQ